MCNLSVPDFQKVFALAPLGCHSGHLRMRMIMFLSNATPFTLGLDLQAFEMFRVIPFIDYFPCFQISFFI